MLFFNFLCLFYLMVLINGHTISKSKINDDEIINVIDSVHDVEENKEHDLKHKRFHHKHGFREEPVQVHELWATTNVEKKSESLTTYPNDNINVTIQVSEKPGGFQTPKSRPKGFLRRIIDKIKRRKTKYLTTNDMIENVKTTPSKVTKYFYDKNKTTAKINDNSYTRPKRSNVIGRKTRKKRKYIFKRNDNLVTNKDESVIYDDGSYRSCNNTSVEHEKNKRHCLNENDGWENNYQFTKIKSYQPIIKKNSELSLSEMTTKIDYLKEVYGISHQNFTKYMPITATSFSNYNLNQLKSTTMSTTLLENEDFEKDFIETAQIEELLNSMKMRAVQVITNQNPVVTNIVSNSVTETVFEAIPSLRDTFSLGRTFSIGSYIPLSGYDFTNLQPTEKTVTVRNVNNNPTLKMKIKRELMTRSANNTNVIKVKELRKAYKNVKDRLSKEIKESGAALKDESKHWAEKFSGKRLINHKTKYASNVFKHKTDDKTNNPRNREKESILKYSKNKYITDYLTYTTPITDDDYAMLSLYEQSLAKAHQESPITVITTESISKRNAVKDERSIKSIRDQNISFKLNKETDKGVNYDTVDPTDEYDDYESVENETTEKNEPALHENKKPSAETTTYKDLVDKLSYNDYVNGYKHYLKFQKEQGAQNYSNLVRYQAHKHHSVDDIGKFILNKLPQVPERHKRAFNDESETTEDQDISTKNEESWFRKHFYLFIDSGQPKKFHSSQTVSLRPPSTEADKMQYSPIEKPNAMMKSNFQKEIEETDLEQLANVLEHYKSHPFTTTTTRRHYTSSGNQSTLTIVTSYGTADVNVKFKGMIEKLFSGKQLRNAKSLWGLDNRNMGKRKMMNKENVIERPKRNPYSRESDKEYQFYHSYLPEVEMRPEKRSHDVSSPTFLKTYKKYGYVDVNVVTRPTAVVKLREARNESKLKKFFKQLRSRFHKKKNKDVKKTQKRESLHRIQRSNPLKKLKKMFNVRIDGKPDTRNKFFDYDNIDTRVTSFKPFKYDKTPSLEHMKIEVPNVTEDAKNASHDILYNAPVLKNSILARKYLQNFSFPTNNELTTASDTYPFITDPGQILATKSNPQQTSTVAKTNINTKNKAKFSTSDLIDIKVTTVKTPNEHSTYDIYESTESPSLKISRFNNEMEPLSRISSVSETPSYLLELLQNIHLKTVKRCSDAKYNYEQNVKLKDKDVLENMQRYSEDSAENFNSFINTEFHDENNSFNNSVIDSVVSKTTQEAEHINVNLNRIAKTPQNVSKNTKKQRLTGSRHRYQTVPEYFNDFERWHNDLLHSENFTTWQNILNGIHHQYKYTPPNVTSLEKELSRLHEFLDIHLDHGNAENITTRDTAQEFQRTTAKSALKNSPVRPIKILKRENENHNDLNINQNSNEETFGSLQNYSVKNIEMTNLSRSVSDQYHKLLHPMAHNVQIENSKKIVESKTNKDKAVPINTDAAPETILLLDTTLLAYDDGFNFITDKIPENNEEPSLQSSLNMNRMDVVHTVTKLHKVPEQYFSTPLPMEKKVFDNFLRENNLDVKSVTTPLNLNHLSGEAVKKNGKLIETTSFINFKTIPEQNNDSQQKTDIKIMKPLEFKNLRENTKEGSFDPTPIHFVDEKADNFEANFDLNSYINNKRMERALFKSSHVVPYASESLGAGIHNKYNKLKDRLKIFDRKNLETIDTMSSASNKLDDVEGSVNNFDDLDDHLQFENMVVNQDNYINGIKSETTLKDEKTGKSLLEHKDQPSHQDIKINPPGNKINYTREGPAVSKIITSEKQLKKNVTHSEAPGKIKSHPGNTHLVHNNLLFNYIFGDRNKDRTNKLIQGLNSNPYMFNRDRGNSTDDSIKTIQDTNIPDEKGSIPRKIHIASSTYKYDIIYEDDSIDRTNAENIETTTPLLQVFGNHGFYSMKANGSTNDSENEQIIELVEVVEAVENYTRPNILIHIDLPTYYLPVTNQTDLTPVRCPQKSIWNDFILKYVSGIALLELLTKFGILKTVETNLTDGMGEGVNACGVFSGVAEPRFTMDLTLDDSIRRVRRSQQEQSSTPRALRNGTSEAKRRGTLIYDLKQLERSNSVDAKQRRGPFKSLHGTSVLSLLQKQRPLPPNGTNKISRSKLSTRTENQAENTTTTGNCKHENLNDKSQAGTNNEIMGEGLIPEEKNDTNAQQTPIAKEVMKTKSTTTTALKCSKTLKTESNHTRKTVTDGHGKQTSSGALLMADKAKSKQRKKKKQHHHLAVITTKLHSGGKTKTCKYNDTISNTKLPSTNANITTVMPPIHTRVSDRVSETTKKRSTTSRSITFTKKASSITKQTEQPVITEIGNLFTPTEVDIKVPADEDSFYVTSNNYYDYHSGDLEYNLDESKVQTVEKTSEKSDNNSLKHDKRDLKSQNTFTAKDVAAIEVIVDLMRNSRNPDENELPDIINESTMATPSSSAQAFSRANDNVSNAIQVHIAIPYNLSNEKRRSLNDPVKIRKVFSAKLSTPVDMEYQIHSVEGLQPLSSEPDFGTTPTIYSTTSSVTSTTSKMDIFSPGMYLLVENMNNSMPNGNFILRPVYNKRFLSNFNIRQAGTKPAIAHKTVTTASQNNLAMVTLSKDFIAAVDKHLMQLYQNLTATSLHGRKARKADVKETTNNKHPKPSNFRRQRRHINWDAIKKYFGHDRVCSCRCKANRTMCRACAASDAVISELIFELDNLAQYMNDHCTEIQTFFWMNPSGGRKLREAVHRIDKTLYDYYKRVKGKCKGRPCKGFSYMDKRDFVNFDKKVNYIGDPLISDIENIAEDLEQASKFSIGDETLVESGKKCLDVITKCMHLKPFNKRANSNISDKGRLKNVYSLDNVNVNIICKSDNLLDSTRNDICVSTLATTYLTESPNIFYYDTEEFKGKDKQKKGIKYLLSKRRHLKKKGQDKSHLYTYYITPLDGKKTSNDLSLNKRQINNNYQIESPLITDSGGLFWYNYLHGKQNRNQFYEGPRNLNKDFDSLSRSGTTEKTDLVNATDYEYSNYEDYLNYTQSNTTESHNAFTNFLTDIVTQPALSMHTMKDKVKVAEIPTVNTKYYVKPSKSISRKVKELLILLGADDFGPFAENWSSNVSKNPAGHNRNETSISSTQRKRNNRKAKLFNNAFQKPNTTKRSPITTVEKKMSTLFQPTLTDKKSSTNVINFTCHNFFAKFKQATINFLDKLDGTDNFLIDERTTPIYVYGKTSTSNNRAIRNPFLNNNKDDIVRPLNQSTDANLPKNRINNKNIDIEDSILTNDEKLTDDLDISSDTVESVDEPNKNNELLLSILDFETNKLNDEWVKIARKKTAVDDDENDLDDVGQTIFQMHSDFRMSSEKTTSTKSEPTTNVTKKSFHNQTITAKSIKAENVTKGNTTDGGNACGKCYDILEDMRGLELSVPPEITSTRAYNGFLDKFMHKFTFKIVPGSKNKKAANTHLNGPKGRSLKGKMAHGQRHRGKVHCKTKTMKNNTDSEDLDQPTLSLSAITAASDASKRNVTRITSSGTSLTTKSAIKVSATTTTITETGNAAASTMPELTKRTKVFTQNKEEDEEVCESNDHSVGNICDMDATIVYIEEMYQKLPINDFEKYVKNISCFKYKRTPKVFHITATSMRSKKKSKLRCKTGHLNTGLTKKILKWNWIRDKRSMNDAFSDLKSKNEFDNEYVDVDDGHDSGNDNIEFKKLRGKVQYVLGNGREDYDRLYLGSDGVYRRRENERKKRRAVDMTDIVKGLRNLPHLRQLVDETFVIRGESITIQCNVSDSPLYSYTNLSNLYQYTWSAERKAMLACSNTKIIGPTISIINVQPKNYGTYTCFKDKSVIRSVRLNVIVIPDFDIVFTPLYKCQGECSYEDLKAIQKLGPVMSKTICTGDEPCSVRIDQPVCMSNKEDEDLLKPTVVMKPCPSPPPIECSPECRRDLQCSLALLWAGNAPPLALVKVIISYDELNKTLSPLDNCDSDLTVFKELKKKDSNGHREYKQLVLGMEPGNVDVVVACPAGFYLLADQKICAVCPSNTCSLAGENACSACPRGTHAEPGAAACRIALTRLHRYDWQWCAWQWCVAVCGVVCAGCVAAGLSARRARDPPAPVVHRRLSTAQARARRPISPSRVILERLFKRSPSSSRATAEALVYTILKRIFKLSILK